MGMEQILMPQLGESVTEGTIERWLVKPGESVAKYDLLAEVTTDKVTAEIPSSYAGVIKELIAKEGDTIEVGGVVCTIETEQSSASTETPKEQKAAEETAGKKQPVQKQAVKTGKAAGRYSPAVLKLSQEHGIDLSSVAGTGNEGRITRKDILAIVESGEMPVKAEMPAAPARTEEPAPKAEKQERAVQQSTPPVSSAPIQHGDTEIPVTSVRRAIAKNMVKSVTEAPHAWTMIEVDVTNLVQLRDSVKEEFKAKEGFNITYFAFFIKAVSQALKEFPMMNSMWAGEKIVVKKDINISIAVATDEALYVPVIHQTDEKTIKAIGRDIHELAGKVRAGKLQAADMQGGTFTVNNTGSFGSVQSMGIINYPQAAILQVESIVKRPVVMDNGMIAVRDIVNLCLSLDHRVLDGLVCGRFLERVKQLLENMSKETTSLY